MVAQTLNNSGFDVDVLCDDYFHCMAYPEWEYLNLLLKSSEQIKIPRNKVNTNAGEFVRPKWFAQGARNDAVEYLLAKRKLQQKLQDELWAKLLNESLPIELPEKEGETVSDLSHKLNIRKFTFPKLWKISTSLFKNFLKRIVNTTTKKTFFVLARYSKLKYFFIPDFLLRPILTQFYGKQICNKIDELCKYYDEVVLFGPSALWAFLITNQKFSFFEHGTVRYASEKSDLFSFVLHRVYLKSKGILVTNGDVFSTPELLPKAEMIPTIHPIIWYKESFEVQGEEFLLREWSEWQFLQNKKFLFSPVRQDWDAKGVDFYLINLKKIADVFPELEFVFTNWGADLESAKQIVRNVNLDSRVHWIDTMSRPLLATIAMKSFLVLDQMALPHFGSTAPQMLALGVPVASSYNPASTQEIAAEPAPILSIFTLQDLMMHIHNLSSDSYRNEYSVLARSWVEKWHSKDRIVRDFTRLFEIMKGKNV